MACYKGVNFMTGTIASSPDTASLFKKLIELSFLVLQKIEWDDPQYVKNLARFVDKWINNNYGPQANDSDVDAELKVNVITFIIL